MTNNTTKDTDIQAGPITYKWQVSTDSGITYTDLVNSPNSSTLSLTNISSAQDNYYYRVIATSGGLTIISDGAELSVFPTIDIVSHPQNQTIYDDDATFNILANISSGSQVSYQWEYSTHDNPNTFSPIIGATGTSVTVTGLNDTDDGNFYRAKIIAKFSDTYPKTVYSNPAQLDYISSPITISQQPQDLYLTNISDPELFTVIASANSELSYQWQESADGINFEAIPFTNNATLYSSSVDNVLNKNQYQYRVLISSADRSLYSSTVTLHTGIELPLIDNIYNNTYLWGDPHLRIQSIKGTLANLDDNSTIDPIVYFYVKYPDGNSYKVVYQNRFATTSATSGPAAIADIWLEMNGKKISGSELSLNKSTLTPSTDLVLNSCTFAGVTGWNYFSGRCLSFSTTAGKTNLTDGNYAQLLRNSIKWLCKNKINPSILLMSSGDSVQDNSLKNILTSLTNKTINITTLNTFNNSNNILSTTDVVVLQNNYNWNTQTLSDAGQNALKSFVTQGGGLLTAEWVIWNMAVGRLKILSDVVPVIPTSAYTTKSPIRYIQNINDTTLNSGVSSDFTFYSTNIAGTETSITRAKTGATIFYHSEQCINNAGEKIISVGDILSIIYKLQGQWNNKPYYNVYTRWNKTISYNGELTIGGVLYWTLKSLIEYKKNPSDTKFSMWKGGITGSKTDGYGLVLKPYGLTRQMFSNAVTAADGSTNLNIITEKIGLNNNFWKNMSKLLRGLKPDDKYYVKNVVYFTKHPGNRLTTPNVAVSMDAQAYSTSGDAVQYRWQISSNNGITFTNITNSTLYTGADTQQLNILKPSLSDNGKVFRLATTSPGAATKYSNHATLTVVPSIVVSTFPTAQTAINGKATFSVTAASTSGALTYQWQKSSYRYTGYTNIAGATTNALVLNVTSYSQHNTYYRVVLTNSTSSFITNGVLLTAAPIISITSQPANRTTNTSTATFSINTQITNPLTTSLTTTYQWQVSSNNRYYSNIPNSNTTTLNLTGLTKTNDKYYYRVVISAGNTRVVSEPAQLFILPTITATNITSTVTYYKLNNIDYADVTMTIGASSTGGTIAYQWQQSKDYGKTYSNISNTNISSITVKNIPKNSYAAYKYRVLISNPMETIIAY